MIMEKMLAIGKICNIHGVRGNIKLIPWTDFPEIFEQFEYIVIEGKKYFVNDVKYQKSNIILSLEGVDTVEKAEKLRDLIAYCEESQMEELPEDTYYIADLIGCKVYEEEQLLGEISDVFPAGGADLYEIKGKGPKIYLPAIKENVLSVDIKNKIIKVKLPEGLI